MPQLFRKYMASAGSMTKLHRRNFSMKQFTHISNSSSPIIYLELSHLEHLKIWYWYIFKEFPVLANSKIVMCYLGKKIKKINKK